MDKTFDYNNIHVDNFDELYDFCISKDTNKKKIKEENYFSEDTQQKFNDDKDTCNKEVLKKNTNIKPTKKHGKNKKSEYSPCKIIEEKRLDMLNESLEDTESYYDRKKKNSHIINPYFALVKATFNLLGSFKNPIPNFLLDRTHDNNIKSFSLPWNASTEATSISDEF